MRVDTVFYWVSDLERSLEWYARAGFEPGSRHGGWQVMAVGGETVFALHEGAPPEGHNAVVSFRVDDLDAHVSNLAEAGILPVDAAPTDTGRALFLTFADPDGNPLQFLERRDG
jgi:catechol 2,3-dioxygenase-like lactoylglutathione lyase family enzyme